MIGIIKRIINYIAGDVRAVERWVLHGLDAAYSYVDRVFRQVWSALSADWKALVKLADSVGKFAIQVYRYAKWIVAVYIRNVIRWAQRLYDTLRKYAIGVYRFAVKWVDYVIKLVARTVGDITGWVIRDIWKPLHDFIAQAWHWVTHEGAYVYGLITHPDRLAGLLAHWIWISWISVTSKYARPIARWLLHQMPGMAHDVIDVFERILEALI